MIRSYQQRRRLQRAPAPVARTAVIVSIAENGTARLRFADGSEGQKYYQVAPGEYAAGQRVRLQKQSGTYVVLGPV